MCTTIGEYYIVVAIEELVAAVVIVDTECPVAVYYYTGCIEVSEAAVFVPLCCSEDVH